MEIKYLKNKVFVLKSKKGKVLLKPAGLNDVGEFKNGIVVGGDQFLANEENLFICGPGEYERNGNELAGIVLDLRNNPGGFLEASVMVASDFLKEGVVVKQESSDGTTDVYKVDRSKGRMLDDKMVVLINGGSASAAEILAGCLQEYKRAKLLGEKSFGKGTVQRPDEFEDGSGLHITIAKWLLPGGKNIHGEGVSPDAEIEWNYEDNDPAYEKVYESLLNDS